MKQYLNNRMKVEPFSTMLDASKDTGLHKIFLVTARLFDINFNGVITKFLEMNMPVSRNASTAQFYSTDTLVNNVELS